MQNMLIWLICIGLSLQLTGCLGLEQGSSSETVRIGVLPDQCEKRLRERYNPLLEFLSQETKLTYELVIPNSYDELVKKFGEGQINLAYLGGVTFVQSNSEHNALPLVMRDVDTRFASALVVANKDIKTFKELQGKHVSFGSRLSTSGHLMPRHFLRVQYGVTPEKYFRSIQYSGKHDRTVYWVRDGKVDAGFVNAVIIRKMLADGRLQPGDIRIIWTTPPYTNYVWAVLPQVHPVNHEKIQQAFLQLSVDNPQHEAILSNLGAASFYPASIKDFSTLKQILNNMGML